MNRVALGDVCDIVTGGTPSRSRTEYFNGTIPWVKIGDMLQGRITTTEEKVSAAGIANSSAKLLPRGTVLISIFATIGRTAVLDIDAATNQAIAGVLPKPGAQLDRAYLRHCLDSTAAALLAQASGVAQVNINSSKLRAQPIPLPALPEQRRIAEVLDRAETLRAQRRQALAQFDALAESIFLDMFGEVRAGPKFPVGAIRPFVAASSGKSSKSVLATSTTAIPIYGGNGVNGWATAALFQTPVLVFGRVGQQCGNAYMTAGPSWVTDNAIVVQVVDAQKLDATYLLHAFRMSDFAQRVKHLDLPFINQAMIVDMPVVVPPLSAQQAFSARVRAVESLISVHRAALVELDALFASVQHRAFRGEL